MKSASLLAAVAALYSSSAFAASITPGNLVIYRVGDGVAAQTTSTTTASAVFLDEYTSAGVLVQSISVPSSGANATTAKANATSEGLLSLSSDKQYIIFAGYRKNAGLSDPSADTAATTNRVIGRLALDGTLDVSTALTDAYSAGTIRGAASSNGSDFWTSGSNTTGLRYTTLGSTTSVSLNSASNNLRNVQVVNNQLYFNAGANTPGRSVFTTSPALPTAANSATFTATYPIVTDTATAPNSFFLADVDPSVAGIDTIYFVSQAGSATNPNGVYKYTFDGSAWTARGSITLANGDGITGIVNGSNVTLYLTTYTSLQTLTDSSGIGGALSGSFTSLTSASSNTFFRGIVVTAVPEPTSLACIGIAALVGMRRRK